MAGMQFFNYDRLGYIPYDCWEEYELEPTGRESSSAKGRKRTRRSPIGYLEGRRALTPEEELLAKEERKFNPDMIELEQGLKFSLVAAAKLARILGYTREELLDGETARVIGFYLAQDDEGDIAGMDGVIGFYLSNPDNPDIAASVSTFVQRMKVYCPEISESSRRRLIKEARINHMAFNIGVVIFGAKKFKQWVS